MMRNQGQKPYAVRKGCFPIIFHGETTLSLYCLIWLTDVLFCVAYFIVAGVEAFDNLACDIKSRVEVNACGFEEDCIVAFRCVIDLDIVFDRVVEAGAAAVRARFRYCD